MLGYKYWKRQYKNLKKNVMINMHKRRVDRLVEEIKAKDRIKVVFFVINISMWKLDQLFRLLQADSRFEPYVASFLYRADNAESQKELQKSMKLYFEERGFPFIETYDAESGKWFDMKAFAPDIIFYAQPYNTGYSRYKLKKFWRNTLFCYIPYCVNLELWPSLYNGLYLELCWRYYCGTESNKRFLSGLLHNNGKGITAVGYTMLEEMDRTAKPKDEWKQKERSVKRFIWAPHHAVGADDPLACSTFLEVAEGMLQMAKDLEGQAQFAFKPHPRLKSKLYGLEEWGKEKTDRYYRQWEELPNTILSDGNYIDLFLTSDAMIHDCGSFMYEYLYTGRPAMFIQKDKGVFFGKFNSLDGTLAGECMNLHTIGYGMEDIRQYVSDIIKGIDPLKKKRQEFIKNVMRNNHGKSMYQIIYEDLSESLARV